MNTAPMHRILLEVAKERVAQDEKWGQQNHNDGTGAGYHKGDADYQKMVNNNNMADGQLTWKGILIEEVWEAFAESDPEKLRAELIQVVAVGVGWIEAIDRRKSWSK